MLVGQALDAHPFGVFWFVWLPAVATAFPVAAIPLLGRSWSARLRIPAGVAGAATQAIAWGLQLWAGSGSDAQTGIAVMWAAVYAWCIFGCLMLLAFVVGSITTPGVGGQRETPR